MYSIWKSAHNLIVVFIVFGNGISALGQSFKATSTAAQGQAKAISRTAKPKDPALFRETIEAYKTALRSAPNSSIILNNMGVEYALAEQYPAAAVHLEKAVSATPNYAPFLINLALVYSNLGRTAEAWALLEKATRVAPNDMRGRKALCDLLTGQSEYRAAIRCYEALESKGELDPVSAANLSAAYDKAGKSSKAIEVLEHAARRFRSSYWIQNALGMIHFRAEDYKLAAEAFKRAVELDPERSEFRFNLATAQLALGNRPGAISQYDFLKRKYPKLALELYKQIYSDKVVFVGNR